MLLQDELENIVGRLRALARDGGTMETVQVKLIGLDEIRDAAGAAWPRLRARVREGSMRLLEAHANPDDVIVPAGDGFLIILAEAEPGQSDQRCATMREALAQFYLGEEALRTIRAEVRPRVLSGEGLTDLLAGSIRAHPPPRQLGLEIAHIRVFMTNERRVGPRLAAPVCHQRGGPRLAYNPEFILDGRHHGEQDFVSLDISALDEALAALATAQENGTQLIYGCTVHASTLQRRRAREEYLSFWRRTPPQLKRSMFITIAEIERGTPLLSMVEWASALRPHVTRIVLNFHWSDRAITNLRSTGAWSAGFHLPIYAGAQRPGRSERLQEQVRFWSKAMHANGMRLAVDGFQDPDFLAQCSVLGVDFATSDLLWPFSEGEFGQGARASEPSGEWAALA